MKIGSDLVALWYSLWVIWWSIAIENHQLNYVILCEYSIREQAVAHQMEDYIESRTASINQIHAIMMDVNQMTMDIKNETQKQAKPLEQID